jgi:cysteine desulfurase/selenocysteine lyase
MRTGVADVPGRDVGESLTPEEVDQARRDTPGTRDGIFLDSAGSSLMPAPVVDAVRTHLDLEAHIGGYAARDLMADRIAGVYASIARLIGAQPREIALLENATRAWDAAFYSLRFQPGDRILTDVSAYGSNYLAFLQMARKTRVEIVVVPDDADGQLDVEALEAAVTPSTRLIAVTWIPTASGRVNPAYEVGAVARSHQVLYLLDACQAVGQLPIDVIQLGCDFLSGTGRKYLRGPRGTGFLYVRDAVLDQVEPPAADVRSAEWVDPSTFRWRPDATRFETWEMNYAAVLGLGRAVDYALGWGINRTWERIRALAEKLRRALSTVGGVVVRDTGRVQGGIVTFSLDGVDARDVRTRLADRGIRVSVSTADGQLLDFRRRNLPDLVRASVHYFNTEDELDAFVDAVRDIRG